jgi:hypothetical protein
VDDAALVFLHRHRPGVPFAAPIEVARGGVMEDMLAAPAHVGRERDRAGDEPDDIVREAALEVGSVGAVVHDDERPHDEERRWNREEEGDPVRTGQGRAESVHAMARRTSVVASCSTLR